MVARYIKLVFIFALFSVLVACSTEKNTFINRTYHATNARYNGYFNANELLRQSMTAYRSSLKEDFYAILPIDPMPNAEAVIGMYPAIDTAIVKCTKVIQKHSMPSNDKPSLKKVEYNPWVDENWITIGIAHYYRRDYDAALKNFKFIRKFYSNDPSIFVSDLWMAKTNMAIGKLTDATFNLASIDKALEEQASAEANKEKNPTKSKSKKKDKKEAKIARVPKSIRFDFQKTKAELALQKNQTQDAIQALEMALQYAKKSTDKARVNFIIAQLYESLGNKSTAKEYYSTSLRFNSTYEMQFNARMKRAYMGADEKVKMELLKMLRDLKNAQFKDQIYYALADMEMEKSNTPKAKEYYTLSAFYSVSNNRQKGMAYEKMGNLSFSERNYIAAQKYFDSCAKVVDDKYPNVEAIRNKALKLADLVTAVETAFFEDSVQRIAALSPDDRKDFIEKVIKKKKEEEVRRKKMEAEKLRDLQQVQNNFAQTLGTGNKWYFNNAKTRAEGFNEFRRLWGTRENEDDWRRSEKVVFQEGKETEKDSLTPEVKKPKVADSLTVDMLLADIPLSDSALAASQSRLLEALYAAGIIYKEQLNEPEMAKTQFKAVRKKKVLGDIDLSAAYQLYKIDETVNTPSAAENRSHILSNYPESDYANFLLDPDFFLKRKEREALAEQEYITVLERYNRGLYYPVITKADQVIETDKTNVFRAKYMLLKVLCVGQTNNNKKDLLPLLNQLIAEYPGSSEAQKANEMVTIITTGYSVNEVVDFSKNSIYSYNDKAPHWVIVFLDANENSALAKTKVSDFNKEFFSRVKLKVSSKLYTDQQSIILVQEFPNDVKAAEYVRVFKATRKHLMNLQKAKIMLITQDNLKVLFESKKLTEYEQFTEEFY